jgi:lipoprotein-anchoring transpeptidase ErfK/SrfK
VTRRGRASLVVALAALTLAALGVYALDRANADRIADGIQVGRVDIGGLSTDEARDRLHAQLARPLERPVTVRFEGHEFTASADRLGLRANVDAMVDAALAASRDGSLPSRVWRYATGGDVERTIAPRITYSDRALDSFVAEVSAAINRPAQDATVAASADSLNTVPGQDGVSVHADELRHRLDAAIRSRGGRTVTATVDRVQPQVTTDQLAQKYPVYLTVDRGSYQLRLWKNLKLAKTYTVAVGQAGLETPAGGYTINDKQVNPSWHVPDSPWAGDLAGKVIPPGPQDPIKARWMGFYAGAGIHGTDDIASLGSSASHGCIRMAIPDVIELYDQVPLGTPIYVG